MILQAQRDDMVRNPADRGSHGPTQTAACTACSLAELLERRIRVMRPECEAPLGLADEGNGIAKSVATKSSVPTLCDYPPFS